MDGMAYKTSAKLSDDTDGWNFVGSQTDLLGSIHPYPAKFISAIPRKLIEEFRPAKGLALLDPFCGSGTALSEAQAAGLPSIGVDLNPIAVMMSRVKTAPLPLNIGQILDKIIDTAQADIGPNLPTIPRLDHWFLPQVQLSLAALGSAISAHGGTARDIMRLALSSIIVRVSNQESDTRYAAIQKTVTREDVFRQFHRATHRIVEALHARAFPLKKALVVEADAQTFDFKSMGLPVGLVVTSPPYPNAYEYWLYHKYRMWWLGFDPLAVKAREIGARAHFFSGKNSHTAKDFGRQMKKVMLGIEKVLVPSGHACFVVGRSRIHGEVIDNAATIVEIGTSLGFGEVMRIERIIAPTRKSFNLSHANIKTETVLVLRKKK